MTAKAESLRAQTFQRNGSMRKQKNEIDKRIDRASSRSRGQMWRACPCR
jgi:hypothetical protein